MAPGNALQQQNRNIKVQGGGGGMVGGTEEGGICPRQFQSPTCHAFSSGTQLFL